MQAHMKAQASSQLKEDEFTADPIVDSIVDDTLGDLVDDSTVGDLGDRVDDTLVDDLVVDDLVVDDLVVDDLVVDDLVDDSTVGDLGDLVDPTVDDLGDLGDEIVDVVDDFMPEEDTLGDLDSYMGRSTGWQNWIGKYKFAGATDWWLEGMYEADANKDGNVTLMEAVQAAQSLGSEVSEDVMSEAMLTPDRTDWDQDLDLLTQILPLGFDHNGDGLLNYQETVDFFNACGMEEDGPTFFVENATLDYSNLFNVMEGVRFGDAEFQPDQFEGTSEIFGYIREMDQDGDAIINLSELIDGFQAMGFGMTVDKEEILNTYGADYDWVQDNELIAMLMASDHEILTYDGLYDWCESIGYPWVADDFFTESSEQDNNGADLEHFIEFIGEVKTLDDAWWMSPSDDWVPRDERFDETFKLWWDVLTWDRHVRPSFTDLLMGVEMQVAGSADDLSTYYGYAPDFEWWAHPTTLAELVLMGADDKFEEPGTHHHLDYEQCYHVFDFIGFPWILDTMFVDVFNIVDDGATTNAVQGFMEDWMFESDAWATSPPEGWLTLEDRIVPWYPYEPTEEILRIYLRDEIADAIEKLEELDAQVDTHALEDLDWDHEDDEDFDDLSDLLFEVQDYAEGTYVVM